MLYALIGHVKTTRFTGGYYFIYTPNEARAYLDKPAMAGGNRLLGNGASIPVELAGTQYTNNSEGKEEEKKWIEKSMEKVLKKFLTKE